MKEVSIKKYALKGVIELCSALKWLECFFYYLFMRKKIILIRAAVIYRFGKVKHFNWGDDINFYFLSLISRKKIVFIPHGKIAEIFPIPCYLGIGSIISFYNLNKTTILGSGIINNSDARKIKGTPAKICFVRGPKTRTALIEHGINCPENYGDLALALPLYYKPIVNKKYKLGIVLHLLDEKLESVQYIQSMYQDIKFIHMNDYVKWTDVIDEINSCEIILSSALHGLIVSEAYKICCKWIAFEDSYHSTPGYEFKYLDFYASIEKTEEKPIKIDKKTNLYTLAKNIKESWTPNSFDARKVIEYLPTEFRD